MGNAIILHQESRLRRSVLHQVVDVVLEALGGDGSEVVFGALAVVYSEGEGFSGDCEVCKIARWILHQQLLILSKRIQTILLQNIPANTIAELRYQLHMIHVMHVKIEVFSVLWRHHGDVAIGHGGAENPDRVQKELELALQTVHFDVEFVYLCGQVAKLGISDYGKA